MLPESLLVFISALSVASAGPIWRRCANTTDAVTPTLPNTGAAKELASPFGLTLKHITVGHGIQNYSCSAVNVTATSAGALAVLYDVTSLYPGSSTNALSTEVWHQLPVDMLRTTDIPLNLVGNAVNQYAANTSGPFAGDANTTVNGLTLPLAGHHYFDATLVPTFNLYKTGEMLVSAKLDGIKAPTGADPGLLRTGAVDWLELGDKGLGTSVGLTQVYRVSTAGGSPVRCSSVGETFSVPYAAMYWFYAK
ncbi:malate dehydrogenase [Pseudomassariella vexata]|uniref:Malate dehydrogenase n=1 Tax=Pseudomassariella vexata TaxID=1141098 RepID=A0A1Y2ECH3_9PEZI|nr:malate dehydrogenase [Pseudomassariella vexata]ORY69107.1 malate dehydrogenase [Pseudomassariella vexata]